MADRFPLVVNSTTNQITEVMTGDDLLFDNTELKTSTGNLVLNPAADLDIQKDIVNTVGTQVKIDDDLEITQKLAIGTTIGAGTDIRIGRTWNNNAVTFMGIDIDITPTQYSGASRLVRFRNTGVDKFTIDKDGNTQNFGTLSVSGATTLNSTLNAGGAVDLDSTLNVDGNTTLVGTLGVTGNTTLTTLTASGAATITGAATFSSGIDANSTLNVQGISTFQNNIVPATDEGSSLGSGALPWSSAHIGEIEIANGTTGNDDNTISTATGNLFLSTANGATGVINITGTIIATSDAVNDNLRLVSTDSAASAAPDLALYRNSASPANDDALGNVRFYGNNSNGTEISFARIYGQASNVTNSSESAEIYIDTMLNGTNTNAMQISATGVTIPGNLTVNGTQTILNTSTLQVEDNTIELRKGNNITGADAGIRINRTTNGSGVVQTYNQLTWDESEARWGTTSNGTSFDYLVTAGTTNDLTGTVTFTSLLESSTLNTSNAPAAAFQFYAIDQNVSWNTLATTQNVSINFRGSAPKSLNNHMDVGDVLTATMVLTNGATAYKVDALTIDGSAPAVIKWAGGISFPPGVANAIDTYVFTIVKTAASTFTVLASQSNFS